MEWDRLKIWDQDKEWALTWVQAWVMGDILDHSSSHICLHTAWATAITKVVMVEDISRVCSMVAMVVSSTSSSKVPWEL